MSRLPLPLPGLTGRRARWRRRVLRRVLSALLAAAAVLLIVVELRPPPEAVAPALVAARDVPAGAVLTDADLRVDHVPRSSVQPGSLAGSADAVGRRVGAGLTRGEHLTASRLVPRGALDGLPPGRVAVHVVSADPAAVDLLVPGVSARIYPAAGGPALAVGATVLAADPPGAGTAALSETPPRGVVLSLSAAEADAVLTGHGSLEGPVTVTVVASAR
jgi:pilus assembly protein CpaB